jgi:ABC-type nitrate/sulfonate/bicarbonate transport system substrate-binding protein
MVAAAAVAAFALALSGCGDGGNAPRTEAGKDCDSISRWEYMSRTQPSDPLLAYFTVGRKLGYFEQDCVDFVPVTVEAGEATVRAGADTNVTVSGADRLITLHADDPNENLVGFMNYTPNYHAVVAVMPDSPYNEMADLAGATLGIFTTAVSYYDTTVAELKALGLDHENGDYRWVEIPQGAPSANALQQGDIDAIVTHDTSLVAIQGLLGHDLKVLKHSVESFEALPGPFLAVHKDNITQRPDELVGLIRGFLRAWAFVDENLEAAVRIHIEEWPELVGLDETEEEAVARVAAALAARHANNQAPTWLDGSEYMYFYPQAFEVYLDILGVPATDRQRLIESTYTNEFVERAYEGLDLEAPRADARNA